MQQRVTSLRPHCLCCPRHAGTKPSALAPSDPALLQMKEGETFESETDTEVIPKLCNFLYKRLPESIPFPQVRERPRPVGCGAGCASCGGP